MTGVRATNAQATSKALDGRLIHGILTGAVCTQCLAQEHRQSFGWRKQTLPVGRQETFYLIEPLRTSEQIEEGVGIDLFGTLTDLPALSNTRVLTTMHLG
jgi:hypothetical protein